MALDATASFPPPTMPAMDLAGGIVTAALATTTAFASLLAVSAPSESADPARSPMPAAPGAPPSPRAAGGTLLLGTTIDTATAPFPATGPATDGMIVTGPSRATEPVAHNPSATSGAQTREVPARAIPAQAPSTVATPPGGAYTPIPLMESAAAITGAPLMPVKATAGRTPPPPPITIAPAAMDDARLTPASLPMLMPEPVPTSGNAAPPPAVIIDVTSPTIVRPATNADNAATPLPAAPCPSAGYVAPPPPALATMAGGTISPAYAAATEPPLAEPAVSPSETPAAAAKIPAGTGVLDPAAFVPKPIGPAPQTAAPVPANPALPLSGAIRAAPIAHDAARVANSPGIRKTSPRDDEAAPPIATGYPAILPPPSLVAIGLAPVSPPSIMSPALPAPLGLAGDAAISAPRPSPAGVTDAPTRDAQALDRPLPVPEVTGFALPDAPHTAAPDPGEPAAPDTPAAQTKAASPQASPIPSADPVVGHTPRNDPTAATSQVVAPNPVGPARVAPAGIAPAARNIPMRALPGGATPATPPVRTMRLARQGNDTAGGVVPSPVPHPAPDVGGGTAAASPPETEAPEKQPQAPAHGDRTPSALHGAPPTAEPPANAIFVPSAAASAAIAADAVPVPVSLVHAYAAARNAAAPMVTVPMADIVQTTAVAITRHVTAGGAGTLMLQIEPGNMSRVAVRLSFDENGVVRALITTDNTAALDSLRHDSGELNRAFTEAGIRADAQSLQFDTRSGGDRTSGGQQWQRPAPPRPRPGEHDYSSLAVQAPAYRALRTSGRIDLMA